ncbi:YeeE/YedE family protein [Phaeobacter sp. PT47_59]|uniref:YeeE/YedE family protein n=1 Tax=Phaeobacter sp. PT47_59 TaxID=3029979 RepID=UPI0023802804|nr:YeeE/YedE family protein [Phaeobacter sp. PT47_59]MDE4172829.1 YeeE/YedE family protein [Phaeobacter sp. PT47_59]
MFDVLTEHHWAAIAGLGGGILLGLAARLGRFCTLGAIEDILYGGSSLRMRMWILAIGVAVLGSFSLVALGLLGETESYYLSIRWMPIASILGGLMFGYGMALSGNCGYGAIARLGGGDLRSFVIVLVMGVSTYVVLSGPLAPLRNLFFEQVLVTNEIPPGLAHHGAALTGLSVHSIGMSVGVLIILAALCGRELRDDKKAIFWSVVVGLAIVSGWGFTSKVNTAGFEALPVVSHSFSAPLGETILWTMTGSLRPLSFAVGSIAGVWAGAFIGSLIKGHFRWEACEDPRELRRQILGAGIMGAGAVIALGCTVGQGLSAFSLLAVSAPVTFLAIFVGAALGLRQLIEGFSAAE